MKVLYPPTIDWGFMFQRPQHLMAQFAQHGWEVMYANKTQVRRQPPSHPMENLAVYHDWEDLRGKVKSVDVLWISWPKWHDAKIDAKVVVYDCLDYFPQWGTYEKSMLRRADIVFASSIPLYDRLKKEHQRVVLARNGCDPGMITSDPKPIPQDMEGLTRPIVGFIGALGSWVDIGLMQDIARRFSLVVVGPEFGRKYPSGARCLSMKPYSELPNYYANIDVGIIPFVVDHTSMAADPIKMYEYMAAGKPVVASDIPQCSHYPGVVFPSKTANEFIRNISLASRIDAKDKARTIAEQNSWEIRFAEIQYHILKFMGEAQ